MSKKICAGDTLTVVQPDEPTEPGVLVRIDADSSERVWVVVDPHEHHGRILRGVGGSQWWTTWEDIKRRAGNRRIIVSTPPRWPDETPDAPARIEVGEWPDDDTHLRAWKWVDIEGEAWRWDEERKDWRWATLVRPKPLYGPWTRGERLTEMQEDAS